MLVSNSVGYPVNHKHSPVKKVAIDNSIGQPKRLIHFEGNSEINEQRYQEVFERIKTTDRSILRKSILKMLPMSLIGPLFPASLMPTLTNIPKLPPIYIKNLNASAQTQAKFLVTHDLNALNDYLPYRKLLTEQGDKSALASYDSALKRVLKEAEFYETSQPDAFQKNLNRVFKKSDYRAENKALFKKDGWKTIWYFLSNRKYRQDMLKNSMAIRQKHISKVSREELAKPFKALSPLADQDIATRYLIAGQIADLLYKNPHYLNHVLKQKSENPLRFVVTKDSPSLAVGSFLPGLNTITLNKTFLWLPKGKNTTAQHEFIHASSAQDSLVGDLLPYMSPTQQEKFKTARTWLVEQHETKGSSLFGKLKFWLTGKTATGIRNYTYYNDYEFLTVTLDAFKTNPKGLCQTEAGKQIYQVYKQLFRLDPLTELT